MEEKNQDEQIGHSTLEKTKLIYETEIKKN